MNLHRLVNAVNEKNNVTLTIWSSSGDSVNVDALRKLIFSFGLDKVYVDVPEVKRFFFLIPIDVFDVEVFLPLLGINETIGSWKCTRSCIITNSFRYGYGCDAVD